jgi:choline-sulfatase
MMQKPQSIFLILPVLLACGLGSASPLQAGAPAVTTIAARPNVVLIVVDTLNAQHLGSYSPGLKNSPNIDALARSGVRFENSYAVSSWTKPAIASILTSKYPSEHGVINIRRRLPGEALTLTEFFKAQNFDTVGVTSHVYLEPGSGFEQGFEIYEQLNRSKGLHTAVSSSQISDRAVSWLTENAGPKQKKPFFMLLHYFDPHYRYMHHPEFDLTSNYRGQLRAGMSFKALMRRRPLFEADDTEYLRNLYREEIAFTDSQIQRVVRSLTERGINERTLVILTADHGEEFLEHGSLGHTQTLYEEILRVPLIFYMPGAIKPLVIEAPVNQLDIFPTLLALFDSQNRSDFQGSGISLLPAILGKKEIPAQRDLFAEVSYSSPGKIAGANYNLTSVRSGSYKLIHDQNKKKRLVFDLDKDPKERRSLFGVNSRISDDLLAKLHSFEKRKAQAKESESSAQETEELPLEDLKKLQSLGYF